MITGRYQFQNTESPVLSFSALLANDGTRDVRFEQALRDECYPGRRISMRHPDISCDPLLEAQGPKALYPQYLTVRVCRLMNMNFGESTFLRTRLRRPSSVNKTLLGGIMVVVERLAPLDLKGSE